MKRFKPLFECKDERGVLREVIRFDQFRQFNEALRLKGQEHESHYHKKDEELFYVMYGKVEVKVENKNTGEKWHFTALPGEGFIVYPYESHSFYFLEDTLFAVLHSSQFDKNNPDIYGD